MHKETRANFEGSEGPRPRVKEASWNGSPLRLYTIGWLRYMTMLADVTIRGWEKKGILPKPFFKLGGNVRYYTPAELMAYSAIIHQHYQGDRNLKELKAKLGQANMTIRKNYLGMKAGQSVPAHMLKLLTEKQIITAFTNHENKKALNRENFGEIKTLIEGSGSGETRAES
jgi:DNA-binding transcriptional MerR regulator